ncbi:MAG: protein kinase [Elusimicrobia bacterium]|nr:protein kinase [Elusimicrobiota bacterium]
MSYSRKRALILTGIICSILCGSLVLANPDGTDSSGNGLKTPEQIRQGVINHLNRLAADTKGTDHVVTPEALLNLMSTGNGPEAFTNLIKLLRESSGKGPVYFQTEATKLMQKSGIDDINAGQLVVQAFVATYKDFAPKPPGGPPPENPQGPQPSLGTGGRDTGGRGGGTPADNGSGKPKGDWTWSVHNDLDQADLNYHPNDSRILGNNGIDAYYNGNNQRAFDLTSKAIKNGSTDPNVWVAYGGSAYQLGDHALANDAGKTAWDMDPGNQAAERLYKLSMDKSSTVHLPSVGVALGALNRESYEAAMKQAGGAPKGTSFFGTGGSASNMTAAQIAAAAARQSEAPRTNVDQSATITKEAATNLGVHDYEGAYNLASKAIDLNPRNAQAWNYRAIADNKLSKYSDAVYDSSFALGLVPGNAPALQSRSWAFAKQGKYKEALADANYTLEKEPENSFAYQNRAFALAGLGDKDGALASLRRSAELDPRFKDKLDRAMQAPQESDLMFLFDDEPGAKLSAAGGAPAAKKGRFMRLFVLSIAGGLLVAIGLLHIVSASWREKVRSTLRRVIGAAPQAAAAADAGGAPVSGFWSQYQVLRQIGTGGMGMVYEAKDLSLERTVAIKKMRDEIRAEPSERQRFITEARTVAALHHPNIVDIYSIIEDEADVYLVFEYVDGLTLGEVLRDKGAMDFDSAVKVLRGACEAVDYAHRQKVIHRDIKCSNIMLAKDGGVKVMDFGVARQAKGALTKMSLTNTVVGTPPYMAPEQEQGTVRKESDVFGLGVVFYELLSNKLPFNGQGAGMLLNKINGRHNPLSSQVRGGLPAGIDEVIAKSLAPDPEKRYRTPAEFLAAVEALASSRAG